MKRYRSITHLESRPARSHVCRCGASVLVGQDGGIPYTVDQHPISAEGEVAALVEGRWTFRRRGAELYLRELENIRAGFPDGQVFRAHRCVGIRASVNGGR